MSNTIRIKKRAASGSAGAPSSLSPSELAFNEADLKLYYGFGDNGSTPPSASSIITVGGAGAFFNKTDTKDANRILAGPASGSAAAPTFRALVAADIPSLAHTKISDFDTGVQANRVDQLASATNPVTGVTPTADAHFATKSYVDGVSQGLDVKQSVKVGTTANITLSGTQTIDGVAVSADERVLVKNQSTASENGLYLCKASTWARTDDLAAGVDAAGAFAFVEQGTVNADNAFVCTSNKGSAVVGTNNLAFTQFSGAGQITAGDGLDKSANTLSLDLKSNGGLVIESTELALDLAASSITGTLPVTKLTSLTSTVTELNVLDGITSTTAELNLMDGGTSATATTLAAADRFVCNDAGTMKQVALSSLVTFLEDESASAFNIDGGTY
ncbi:phage-related tail fiber protein [uncultured Mediterranean phage uvMED]|nr:phage-related tail fiber protein [uncultured Mediterranean phage uvMED]BAQ92040.1 phage-related tail fiber protein [uncultured Mediterranean phage uvMED]